MSNSMIKLSAVQMVSTDDIEHNLARAEALIREVVEQEGATTILLPENFLCFSAKHYFDLASMSDNYLQYFSELSRELGVSLILGSLPMSYRPDQSAIDGKLRSASIVINPLGEVLARYDKRHLFDVDVNDGQGAYRESKEFEAGQEIIVAELDGLRVGLSICYDLRFPGHYQSLRELDANVLVVPAAFTEVTGNAHWETLLRARAIENQCYVLAANQGGQHSAKRATWGHSMIIDPWGEVLTKLEKGEGYCTAIMDFELLKRIRKEMPVPNHRIAAEDRLLK